MSRRERIVKELVVEPGTEASIASRDPAWTGGPEFEEAVTAPSTPWAHWYVVPADHAANAEARRRLAAEPEETG